MESQDRWTGKVIGGCQLLEFLGDGGMGLVYKGVKTSLNKVVAIKILNPVLCHRSTTVMRFLQEAKTAAALNHPNIVTINNVGEEEGYYFIEMEYLDGPTLKEYILETGPILVPKALHILKQMAQGLAFAHQSNILHRDIKPGNIMFSSLGNVKITDFGLAKFLDQDLKLSKSGEFLGTPHYMAPEIVAGDKNIDARSDVYSLGISFYEMLTGVTPFHGNTPIQVAYRHVTESIPSVQSVNRSVPRIVETLIAELTAKDPKDRLKDGGAALMRIQEVENIILDRTYYVDETPNQNNPKSWTQLGQLKDSIKTPRVRRFPRYLIVGGLFLIFVVVGVAIFLFWHRNLTTRPEKKTPPISEKPQPNEQTNKFENSPANPDESVVSNDEQKVIALWEEALSKWNMGELEAARTLLLQIMSQYPNSPMLHKVNEKYKLANDHITRRETAKIYWDRILKKVDERDYEQSSKLLKEVIDKYPDPQYLEQALSLQKIVLEKILDTDMAKTLWEEVQSKIASKSYDEALATIQGLIKQYPDTRYALLAQEEQNNITDILSQRDLKNRALSQEVAKIRQMLKSQDYPQVIVALGNLAQRYKMREISNLREEVKNTVCPIEKKIAREGLEITFVRIPNGKFEMGTPEKHPSFRPDEKLHWVTLERPFYIGKYEITVEQYRAWKKDAPTGHSNHPVVNVSCEDAFNFCKWLSEKTDMTIRLPSEAEWEYVCRAGSNTNFSWGDDANKDVANYTWEKDWIANWRKHSTVPVGSFLPNPWNVHDMHGNAWEWVGSTYSFGYNGEETQIAKAKYMVVRGGGWNEPPDRMRCAYRSKSPCYKKDPWTGFRVLMEVSREHLPLFVEQNN